MYTVTTLHTESEHLLQCSQSDNVNSSLLVSGSSPLFEWLIDGFENSHDAIWRDACSELFDTVCNLRKVVDNLATKMSSLSTDITLQNDHEVLKNKMRKLEAAQQKLIVGQVAFLTDEAILTYVVKDPKKRDLYNIYQMEEAISKTKHFEDVFTNEERQIAAKRWDELKKTIGWQDKHYRFVTSLKQMRIESAHPKVSEEELKRAIDQASIDEALKSRCKDLL